MAQALAVCGGVSALFALVFVFSAWSVLEPWEIGLDYNSVIQSISPEAWGSGRHWIGVGHSFVRFKSTVTTVEFTHDMSHSPSGGRLSSRTADGLEVYLELSFQYRLLPETLYKMYTAFGDSYHDVFVKMGMDLLTMAATKHIARSFFVNRTMIGNMMEESLRLHFKEHAFVDVPLFQFQAVSLPEKFDAAIKDTQVAEQKIKRMREQQKMQVVEYETEVIQAQRYVKVQEQQALGLSQSIALTNLADVQSMNASQILTATAFRRILDLFDGDTQAMLKYMKVRAMREHPSERVIIGIKDNVDVLSI